MERLYHFTDTARLPYILQSGELRPGRNKIGGYPDPDFLWATAQMMGDRTASAGSGATYRSSVVRLVRISFERKHFRPWREIVKDYPQWTDFQIERLERSAKGMSNPSDWWCRADPLGLSDCLFIETKSYTSPWTALTNPEVIEVGGALGVAISGEVYLSIESDAPNGAKGYAVNVASERDLMAAMATFAVAE